ncbi:phage integrase [Vibrio parahaemolyticus]|uniref:phage integrase n=1 Tax=Vibrio parahaemolyticus TaxID=670 RepID=UPI001D166CCA|nr:tyrosine-type recombinase/integrase [Vibrio parahaemolyticus]MCC3785362.1 tyrosine-type recombinase/integrase [Vibrio parahaemolyticus]MCC3836352.1 tyrosine-type recombinase/integrase [Vibrio parahaemolyticus]MCC3837492.1 tyrosine-type recombinase/integrase [Vibrio parahaemolyticus]HCG8024834.1 tyrosine-type recombinase/integrase [Vibrio parahaemolyticus]HCG9253457.1 tyrosine-type recombinase/integrase [Vibrio parahaemolyticus]
MTIRNLKDGSKKPWLCECYPQGRAGKRVRKRFATKGEATAFELHLMKEVDDKPWLGSKPDNRRLSELVELWFTHYGQTLVNGEVILNKFNHMVKAMRNPVASTFNSKMYAEYRSKRISGELIFVDKSRWNRGKPSVSTLNSELARFKAVFNKLKELGEWKLPNPLEEVKPFKESERDMAFLTKDQIRDLLELVGQHERADMLKIVKLCLSTGARWNEAAQLKGSQLSQYKVTFTNTKTKKNRTVPISKELYEEISKPTSSSLFEECYTPFCYILKNKLGITLPSGQASHVLRHSFASHFMMNGGNILVLRDVLGHADISMTMRYAHFAPDHLSEAITRNPLNNL